MAKDFKVRGWRDTMDIDTFVGEVDALYHELPILVDLDTHKPTDGELNNITYLSMSYIIGWRMRMVDFMAVKITGGDTLESFQKSVAEYMWDHLMGEPDDTTIEDILKGVKAVTRMLFKMEFEIRDSTETKEQE